MPRTMPDHANGGATFEATLNSVGTPATLLLALLVAAPGHAQDPASGHAAHHAGAVQVTAVDYALEAPDEIPPGWTPIRYSNEGEEPHLLFIAQLPEGRTYEEYTTDVVAQFNHAWSALREGEIGPDDVMERLGATLPDWFWTVRFMGGAGIIAPGAVTDLMVHLDPGTYVLECYMKTEDGELHNMEGMLREIRVSGAGTSAVPPPADIRVTLSNYQMSVEGDLTPGRHTVEVHVEEHPEVGFGHNVYVARAEPGDADRVLRWLNFLELDGLAPSPPVPFIGGMHILPEGGTGYFTLDLEPGPYLFVSEYTGAQGVLRHVRVDP
jgi:hypothetical protein